MSRRYYITDGVYFELGTNLNTDLIYARGLLAAAVAQGDLDLPDQEEVVAEFEYELLKDAAQRIRVAEAKRYPGLILGYFRRRRAAYYASVIDPDQGDER